MKHVSLLITFLIIVSINANGRENPFEPTQTYEAEVARLMEIEEDYPYEFQEKENQEESPKSMKKMEEKIFPIEKEVKHTQTITTMKPGAKQDEASMKTEHKPTMNSTIKPMEEKMAPVVKEVMIETKVIKKPKTITLKKAMKEIEKDEVVVKVPKREDIQIHENIDILPFVNIDYTNDKIEIKSKYDVFRKFTLEKNNKIVLDFHAKTAFFTKSQMINTEYFDKVIVGNHSKEKYFRIVIVLKNKPNKYKVTYLDNLVSIVFDEDMI